MRQEIFTRTESLIGREGLELLQRSSILVVGIGGVGSFAAEAVARAGVGSITLADPETIETSNINRQIHALRSTVGRYKVEVMADRIREINPAAKVWPRNMAYNASSAEQIVHPGYSYVIDAIDAIPDKIHLIKNCLENSIPLVSSMGAANRLQPLSLRTADISQTSNCPMAKKIRKELRKHHIYRGLTVVYSQEQPRKNPGSASPVLGSISYVPAAAGLILASVAVNRLLESYRAAEPT